MNNIRECMDIIRQESVQCPECTEKIFATDPEFKKEKRYIKKYKMCIGCYEPEGWCGTTLTLDCDTE